MSVETSIQILGILHFGVVGLSHVFQPLAWARFFIRLRELGAPGAFVVGFMSLWFGSIIVAFHNVWTGLPAVLTVLGWAQVVKGSIYFVVPSFGLRRMGLVTEQRARMFVVPGLAFVAIAVLLGYHVATTWPRP